MQTQDLDKRFSLYRIGGRLALRKIYFEATNDEIKNQAKRVAMETPFLYGWASLELDLSDSEFQKKYEREGEGGLFLEAMRKIETDGPPFVLEGNKIVGMRPKW